MNLAGFAGGWLRVDRRPSLGHERTTRIVLICLANLLHEVAFYWRRCRATLRTLFSRGVNSLSDPSSWPKLGRRSTADTIDSGHIPDVPERVIAYIDGYGNLKTTLCAEAQPWAAGTSVRLRIGGHEHGAIAGDGTFSVTHGQMAFAPGSSGWAGRTGSETHWMEIFLREGNAWETFQRPGIGDQVEVLD
jgi:hypothetical protein